MLTVNGPLTFDQRACEILFSATLRAFVYTDHHPSIQYLSLPRKIKFIIIIMIIIIIIIILIIIIIIIMETLKS